MIEFNDKQPVSVKYARVRAQFNADEISVVLAALDRKFDSSSMGEMVERKLRSDSLASYIARSRRISPNLLVKKIHGASSQVIDDLVEGAHEFFRIPLPESMTYACLPSKNVLARIGLAPVNGSIARGFCIVAGNGFFYEIVLRHNPDTFGQSLNDGDLPALVSDLVAACPSDLIVTESLGQQQYQLAHAVARATGLQYFRVDAKSERAIVTEIKRLDLLHDLDDGSLQHVWLQDVNAPEV